jgi:hypothetical protein
MLVVQKLGTCREDGIDLAASVGDATSCDDYCHGNSQYRSVSLGSN